MADRMARQVYILWDESASPKASLGGYTVVAAIRTFASRLGVIKAVKYYADISTNSKARILPGLASELQCSGVSVIDTVSGGREGASSKMMLADCFILALDNPDPSKFVLVVITADPDTCYSISSLRLRGYCVPVICPLNADVNIARLSDLRTLGVSASNTLSEIAANVRAMLDTLTESKSPSSNERSQGLTCQSYSPVQSHTSEHRDLEDKTSQGSATLSTAQSTWSPFAVPHKEDDDPSIAPSTSTAQQNQPGSSGSRTQLRPIVSPSTSLPEFPAVHNPVPSPFDSDGHPARLSDWVKPTQSPRLTVTPFSAQLSRPTSSGTAISVLASRLERDRPDILAEAGTDGNPTTVLEAARRDVISIGSSNRVSLKTLSTEPGGPTSHSTSNASVALADFRSLIECLRAVTKNGTVSIKKSKLSAIVTSRPDIFERATAKFSTKPVRNYLREAEEHGIIVFNGKKGKRCQLASRYAS